MPRNLGGEVSSGRTIATVPKSGWTDPAKDDLVIWDTTANFAIDECVADENPIGRVIAVNRDKDVVTVELFTAGSIYTLPYSVAPSRGDKIEVGATANQVRADNSNGVGKVVAVDRVTGYVDVYFG